MPFSTSWPEPEAVGKSRKDLINKSLPAILMEVYESLYAYFGPRHWWPARTRFEVIVGAILTQSVSWRSVEKAIRNLEEAGILSVDALAGADLAEIEQLIVPSLYYRIKARKLKAFVMHLVSQYRGSLDRMFNRPLAELRGELLGIFGIGPETADSILLYAGNYPIFVVDTYTHRIFGRYGIISSPMTYDQLQRLFMDNLPCDVKLFNEFHALIDALGNDICHAKRPKCPTCPLQAGCRRKGI